MAPQTDQTAYIVIGISLIVTAISGWLAYVEYGQKKTLRDDLNSTQSFFNQQQKTVRQREQRLQKVSDALGWKSAFLLSTTSVDQSGELTAGTLKEYPEIESLVEEGNLVQETRRIMNEQGYPEDRINEVTSSSDNARSFLENFYVDESQQVNQSLSSLRAMGKHLEQALSVVPVLPDNVDTGALGNQYESDSGWSFSDPDSLPSRGSISERGITYRKLLEELSQIRSDLYTKTQELTQENKQIRQKYFSYVQGYGTQAQVPSLIEQSRNEIQNLEQQVDNLLSNLDGKRQQLLDTKLQNETNLFQKKNEKRRLLDQQTQELIKKRKQMIEAEHQLNRLKSIQQRSQGSQIQGAVDGRILSSNSSTSAAFINIGRKDGLFTGQTFQVFTTRKGDREIQKGEIRVTELFDRYARARILSQNQSVRNPIQSGDFIRNDEFKPGKTRTFVLAGQFSGSNDEPLLREMIEDGGHDVTSAVSINTSYLVIGSNYERTSAYEKANELSVKIITPAKLRQMLDRE